jgi:uncharacterized protein (DUF305 family)
VHHIRRVSASTALVALAVLAAACTGITSQGATFDQQFIDMMVPHHESAIAMAELAQERAEHPELRTLADEVVSTQSAEIEQLTDWRAEWFGSADTPGMDEMPMLPGMSMPAGHSMDGGTMDMTADVDALREAEPFDRDFIDSMIRHHEQAVEAAELALTESERDEIRALAEEIIDAQTSEIEQLREWRESWY